ncbi:MAG: LLM class F420-dependent oxidoreductase [Pseudomonadales bacterium]|jgi:probable F420-dependent oxidoreductase|nr:LLM class F420-dependent oxidoreductase [Pseudomonadales bacterium]MDP6471979.1 LLM class F420-dependent oxidoreductase [Pseudomonadales bacterium]MDP6826750.1 LLM class F420-dependent oxidoreductase [Pseudomonadales bacterium]MDP6971019.1 LLM class F420-dependent oxidoreductase [Pseudomonadales bacterium]|tara:strand:- start:1022 stop:1846 length:825 start_codon:yes stop_codon:yes gene_type:complete
MKYGFVVPNNFGVEDPLALITLAVEAERLGFDSVWVNHHVLNLGYVGERLGERPYWDALVTLTWIASATQHIALGTSVLVMPYLHPMVLAKELATLDCLSAGRLVVGLGVGSLPEENAALGVPYENRGRYSDEFIEVMRLLWATGRASYHGEHFSFDDIVASPKPQQNPHPPIMVGGNRPPALRRVGRYADGWHPMGLPPDSVRKRLPIIREAAAAADRPMISQIQVRTEMHRIDENSVADYAATGVTELVMHISTADMEETLQQMRQFAGRMF